MGMRAIQYMAFYVSPYLSRDALLLSSTGTAVAYTLQYVRTYNFTTALQAGDNRCVPLDAATS